MDVAELMRNTVVCILFGGPVRKIVVNARLWHFEMHPYCGPMPLHKRTGEAIDGTKPFWEAVTLWARQGERVDADGVCVWSPPAQKPVYHLGGRHYTDDPKLAARFSVTKPSGTMPVDE